MLLKLLNNGVKFTERGEVRLECRLDGESGEESEGGEQSRWLVTRVIDTGIGIKEENVSALFKPFQQVDSGLTRQYEGTGLGLSICKRLVELLGGSIWVDSVPGQGSTFTFTLPITEPQNTQNTQKVKNEASQNKISS